MISPHASSFPTDGNAAPLGGSNSTDASDRRRTIYFVCEPIVSGLVILPFVLVFWEAGWNLLVEGLDTSLGQHVASAPILYLIAQLILLINYLSQDWLYAFLTNLTSAVVRHALLQLHCFISAVSYIVQWVAMWTIWDYYTSDDWLIMLFISLVAILAVLVLVGHPCDLVGAPFVISYDSVEYNVRIDTPFRFGKVMYLRRSARPSHRLELPRCRSIGTSRTSWTTSSASM